MFKFSSYNLIDKIDCQISYLRDTFIDEAKKPKNPLGGKIFDFLWAYEDENMQVLNINTLTLTS